jgi:hypothetical protein
MKSSTNETNNKREYKTKQRNVNLIEKKEKIRVYGLRCAG